MRSGMRGLESPPSRTRMSCIPRKCSSLYGNLVLKLTENCLSNVLLNEEVLFPLLLFGSNR